MSDVLEIVPITISDARAFTREHEPDRRMPHSSLFAVGCATERGGVVAVAIVGPPTAHTLRDEWTAEVKLVATSGAAEAQDAPALLYRAAWKASRALGFKRVVAYVPAGENGAATRRAGYKVVAKGRGETKHARPRVDRNPRQRKLRWEVSA